MSNGQRGSGLTVVECQKAIRYVPFISCSHQGDQVQSVPGDPPRPLGETLHFLVDRLEEGLVTKLTLA
jgi:hypothetical protein